MNPLQQLATCGQSVWLDYLKRSLMQSGELSTLIARDGVKGITSNPSIFEKAIGESDEYADAIARLVIVGRRDAHEIYEALAIEDIRAAADVLRPVFDETKGRDGYVSLECSPYLANDTAGTIAEAERLWAAVARPNLMIKVPATQAGIPAIRALTAHGLNVNITLLFSNAVYAQVAEAFLAGLEERKAAGGDIAKIASVASFFVSRIDNVVDKKLDQQGDDVAERLRGKVAIANATLAYANYKETFSGPRWAPLQVAGAQTQRLLWASTSTKNPAYRDVMYVEALIGRDTINTIPPATLDAFRDHGKPACDAIEHDVAGARAILDALDWRGISLEAITTELTADGVRQFTAAFDKLFSVLERRAREG